MDNWTENLKDQEHHKELRRQMVEEQLERRNISDSQVLKAMQNVPRHFFLPPEYQDRAYEDRAIPIGNKQTISQPYMVAVMSQSLEVGAEGRGKKILDVGTGSGYQAAILCEMGCEVTSIERIEPLAQRAQYILNELGYDPTILVGDGTHDLPPEERYDGIVVAAAAPSVPETYFQRINPGGRLVIPVGSRRNQVLKKFIYQDGKIYEQDVTRCIFVPLIGAYGFSEDESKDE